MRKWDAVAVVGALWLAALLRSPVAGQTPAAATPPSATPTPPTSGAQSQEPVPSITTSDGQTFKEVKVFKTVGDRVLLLHSEGTATVPLDSLSDQTRKSLGLRTRAEQASFEAEQTKKGLVRSGNDWVTPAEKQRRETAAKLNVLAADWREVSTNPLFLAWLKRTDPATGRPYQDSLNLAQQAGDAKQIAAIMSAWKVDQQAGEIGQQRAALADYLNRADFELDREHFTTVAKMLDTLAAKCATLKTLAGTSPSLVQAVQAADVLRNRAVAASQLTWNTMAKDRSQEGDAGTYRQSDDDRLRRQIEEAKKEESEELARERDQKVVGSSSQGTGGIPPVVNASPSQDPAAAARMKRKTAEDELQDRQIRREDAQEQQARYEKLRAELLRQFGGYPEADGGGRGTQPSGTGPRGAPPAAH